MENNKKPTRQRANEKACDNAIIKTLSYSATFNYPISSQQIYNFLITRKDFNRDFFEKSLNRLIKKNHIKSKGKRYYLPGVKPVSWNLREKYSKELISETTGIFKILKTIPYIKMACITGSVASHNAKKDDDIDVFIITEKDRTWITRFFVVMILKIIGKYATEKNNQGKVCCNIYLDESKMEWPQNKRNIYIAREIITMQPVIDRENTYMNFLYKNIWVKDYFKNFPINEMNKHMKLKNSKSGLIDKVENTLRKWQTQFMSNKKTSEITTETFIHFNKNNHENEILEAYNNQIENLP